MKDEIRASEPNKDETTGELNKAETIGEPGKDETTAGKTFSGAVRSFVSFLGRLLDGKSEKSKTFDAVQTVIMSVLFLTMIVLLLLYISQMQSLRGENLVEVPIDRMLVVHDSGEKTDIGDFDFDRIIPEFIGYKNSETGSPRGIFGDEETLEFIYKSNLRYMSALFSDSHSAFYTAEEPTGERLWNEALQSERYLYVKYASALPYPVINSYLTGSGQDLLKSIMADPGLNYSIALKKDGDNPQSTDSSESGKTAYIKELFIVLVDTLSEDYEGAETANSTENTVENYALENRNEYGAEGEKAAEIGENGNNRYKYYGISRDENGNITLFSFADESTAYYFDINDISAYDGNRDFVNYEFYNNLLYSGSEGSAKPLADTAVITEARVPSEMVLMSQTMEAGISNDDGTFGEIASFLAYDEKKYTRYTENGETEVFVSQNGFLRITPGSGKVTFEATGKNTGIPLSELSKMLYDGKTMPGKSIGVYELIDICEYVIGGFSNVGNGFSGGAGRIGLNRIYIEDGCIVVKYGFYYNGAAVVGEDGMSVSAYSFRIYNNTLISFSANYCDISYSGMNGVNYSTAFVTDNLERLYGKKYRVGLGADYMLVYMLNEKSDSVPVMSNWLYVE